MPAFRIVVLCLAWHACAVAGEATATGGIKPDEWQTRLFRITDPMLREISPLAPGKIEALPTPPSGTASENAWLDHVRRATEVLRQHYQKFDLFFPEGTAFAVDSKSQTIAVRTQAVEMALLEALTDAHATRVEQRLVFQVHVVQAPARLLAEISNDARTQSDLTPQWQRLQKLDGKSGVQILRSARLEAREGKVTTLEAGAIWKQPKEYKLDAKGRAVGHGEASRAELHLEVSPAVWSTTWSARPSRADLGVLFEYQFAPPSRHDETAFLGEGTPAVVVPLTDYHRARVFTGMLFADGMTRLLAVWTPSGVPAKQGMLQAAFLSMVFSPDLPDASDSLLSMLKKYADKAKPIPPEDVAAHFGEAPSPSMERRVFRVPPDFLTSTASSSPQAPTSAAQPSRARQILEGAGVEFPRHANAIYLRESSALIMVNTQRYIDMVEAFGCNMVRSPRALRFDVQLFQADATLVRQLVDETAKAPDHTATLEKLEALVSQGRATLAALHHFESRSGQEFFIDSGYERSRLSEFAPSETDGSKIAALQSSMSGMEMKLLPIVAPDGAIEITGSMVYDNSPAAAKQFAADSCEIGLPLALHLTNGSARLIGFWKAPAPPGQSISEQMQMAFLRVSDLSVGRMESEK